MFSVSFYVSSRSRWLLAPTSCGDMRSDHEYISNLCLGKYAGVKKCSNPNHLPPSKEITLRGGPCLYPYSTNRFDFPVPAWSLRHRSYRVPRSLTTNCACSSSRILQESKDLLRPQTHGPSFRIGTTCLRGYQPSRRTPRFTHVHRLHKTSPKILWSLQNRRRQITDQLRSSGATSV